MPIQKVCENCSNSFTVPPSLNARRFCSYACNLKHRQKTGIWPIQKDRIEVKCEVCGGLSLVTKSKKGQRFCSQKCMLVWRAPIISAKRYQIETHAHLVCEWCSSEFTTPRSRIKDGRGRFCSRTCRASYVTHRCQSRVSAVETKFADALEAKGLKFLRQHRIGRWTVDIYFPSHGLAVEFDGEYWHSLPRVIEKDGRKTKSLANRCTLLRIPERLWIDNPEAALNRVMAALDEVGLTPAS